MLSGRPARGTRESLRSCCSVERVRVRSGQVGDDGGGGGGTNKAEGKAPGEGKAECEGLTEFGDLSGTEVSVYTSIVAPGGIDPHVHCTQPLTPLGLKAAPGSAHHGAPQAFSQTPTEVSRAALFGGTTSLVDFAVWKQEGTLTEAVERNEQKWAMSSGQSATITGSSSPSR